jgi:hypothetical protein
VQYQKYWRNIATLATYSRILNAYYKFKVVKSEAVGQQKGEIKYWEER